MRIEHLDDRMRVYLGPRRCYAVVEIPDDRKEPVAWSLDEPIERGGREFTHVILCANLVNPDDPGEQHGLPLTTAEAEELARARAERRPG